MRNCESCPLNGKELPGYDMCSGNLDADQCAIMLQAVLREMSWHMDYLIRYTDSVPPYRNKSLVLIQNTLNAMVPPEKPDCLPDGEWDLKVLGNHSMNYSIVVDGRYIPVTNAEAKILKGYAATYRKYLTKRAKLMRGEGVHREGVCPACGGKYLNWNPMSTGSNPHRHNWRCPDCGTSGRTVYEEKFLGHFDIVDGNGNHIETPKKNDHDIYTCPCCGERFDPDDFGPDGSWDHGSGSYGTHGCRATGKMKFSHKFSYHADLRANKNEIIMED